MKFFFEYFSSLWIENLYTFHGVKNGKNLNDSTVRDDERKKNEVTQVSSLLVLMTERCLKCIKIYATQGSSKEVCLQQERNVFAIFGKKAGANIMTIAGTDMRTVHIANVVRGAHNSGANTIMAPNSHTDDQHHQWV